MQKHIPEFLGLIYDSVADPRGWEIFARRMLEVLDADFTHTLITDFQTPSHNYGVAVSQETGGLKAYERVLFNEEKLKDVLLAQPEVSVMLASEFFSEVEKLNPDSLSIFKEGEVCKNYVVSYIRTRQDPAYSVLHLFGRREGRSEYELEHSEFVSALTPHIKQAYGLSVNISHTSELSNFVVNTLNHISAGVFIISYRGGVLAMNSLAEGYIANHDISIERKHLVINAEGVTEQLNSALDRISTSDSPEGEYIRYSDSAGKKFFISCLPHMDIKGSVNREWRLSDGAQSVVFITDEFSVIDLPWEKLKVLYGLTEAESKVVSLLVNGSSTDEIADELAINTNSVRYHLKNCFSKTYVNNQAELVGLILRTLGNLPNFK